MTSALHGSLPPGPVAHVTLWRVLNKASSSFAPKGGREHHPCPCGAGGGRPGQFSQPHAPLLWPHCLPWVIAVAWGGCLCLQPTHSSQRDTLADITSSHHISSKPPLPLSQVPPTSPCRAKSLQGCLNLGDSVASVCLSLCDPTDCSL